jgi:hypothetical protein
VAVSARIIRQAAGRATLELVLRIQPGWHVNAHRPLQDYLIPTAVGVTAPDKLAAIDYPKAEVRRLGFQKEALALYQGETRIRAEIERAAPDVGAIRLELRLQSCSDQICLPPETLRLVAGAVEE